MREKIDLRSVKTFYSFEAYESLTEELVHSKTTTGDNPSNTLIEYTRLNYHRSRRIKKTVGIHEELASLVESIDIRVGWLLIAEPWCGDVPHGLPILAALSQLNDKITLSIILRDENPEVMDQFLTNGTRSMPKLVCYDTETLEIFWTWGPRPAEAQQLVKYYKQHPEEVKTSVNEELQRWYIADKGNSMQLELIGLLEACREKVSIHLDEGVGA